MGECHQGSSTEPRVYKKRFLPVLSIFVCFIKIAQFASSQILPYFWGIELRTCCYRNRITFKMRFYSFTSVKFSPNDTLISRLK